MAQPTPPRLAPGATDAGTTDLDTTDLGTTDLGATDAGATDAGTTDAGTTDLGTTDLGTAAPAAPISTPGARPRTGLWAITLVLLAIALLIVTVVHFVH